MKQKNRTEGPGKKSVVLVLDFFDIEERINEGMDIDLGLLERGSWEREDEELALDFGAGQCLMEPSESLMRLAADEQLHRERVLLKEEHEGSGSRKIAANLLKDQSEIMRMRARLDEVFE